MTLICGGIASKGTYCRVSKWFYVINLSGKQSGQANDSVSIVKRAKERFCNSEMLDHGSSTGDFDHQRGNFNNF